MEEIVNKVALSGLVTIDLEEYYPQGQRVEFDIAPLLFMGMILKEKDFRSFLKTHDWSQYQNQHVAIICSEPEAIIQTWAYMLLVAKLNDFANTVMVGNLVQLEDYLFQKAIDKIEIEQFTGAKVVLKGCSKLDVPASAYAYLTQKLLPVASSIMFGEPCSTVPVYKAKI